jgi:hypothetical protein
MTPTRRMASRRSEHAARRAARRRPRPETIPPRLQQRAVSRERSPTGGRPCAKRSVASHASHSVVWCSSRAPSRAVGRRCRRQTVATLVIPRPAPGRPPEAAPGQRALGVDGGGREDPRAAGGPTGGRLRPAVVPPAGVGTPRIHGAPVGPPRRCRRAGRAGDRRGDPCCGAGAPRRRRPASAWGPTAPRCGDTEPWRHRARRAEASAGAWAPAPSPPRRLVPGRPAGVCALPPGRRRLGARGAGPGGPPAALRAVGSRGLPRGPLARPQTPPDRAAGARSNGPADGAGARAAAGLSDPRAGAPSAPRCGGLCRRPAPRRAPWGRARHPRTPPAVGPHGPLARAAPGPAPGR